MTRSTLWQSSVFLLLAAASLTPGPVVGQTGPATPPNFGCPAAEYRQFHFMLGDWRAGPTNSGKPPQAASKWSALANGCIVLESWQVGKPGEGHSINYYDQADGKWHQHWVDSTGDATHYLGSFSNGKMHFTADDISTPDKKPVKRTMTFEPLPDGRVRQSGTHSDDGGKTFKPSFDLTYEKARK